MNKKIILAAALAMTLSGCGDTIVKSSEFQPETTTVSAADETGAVTDQTDMVTEAPATEVTTTTTAETTVSSPTTTTLPAANETYEFVSGCILTNAGEDHMRALEEYYYLPDAGEYLAQNVDTFADSVGSGTKVYLMIIPSAEEFYVPEALRDDYADQIESTKEVYSKLNTAQGVLVNEVMEQHKGEHLYSNTDFHWQPLGAFYAAGVFAEKAGVPYAGYDTYEKVEREGYLGAFYTVVGIDALAATPETFTYYKPANLDNITCYYNDTAFSGGVGGGAVGQLFYEDCDISASYTVFVGTDNTILQIDTDVDNDRVLVIFKDSYGNALVPFLTQSFSKIYLCDTRYFDINSVSFAQQVGATDVLFAFGAPSSNNYDKSDLIRQNFSN